MSLATVEQLRGARAMLGITQAELARRSRVSLPTIKRLELGKGPLGARPSTREKLQRALEAGGIEFIAENGGGAGVRPRKRAKRHGGAVK